jgi:hypothetical protein
MKEWLKVAWWPMLLWACAEPTYSQLRASDPPPQVLTQECSGLRVQLTLDRIYQSASVADVFVTDAASHMLSDISRVVLAFTRKTQPNVTTTVVARLTEAKHYTPATEFPLTPGSWTIKIIVYWASGSAVSCPFSFNQ